MNPRVTRSVIPDAADLVETWERAAAGREKGEPVEPAPARDGGIDWGGVRFRVVTGLVFAAVSIFMKVVRWLCNC